MERADSKKHPSDFSLRRGLMFLNIVISASCICLIAGGCARKHLENGWYPVADDPGNMIEGEAIITVKDFDVASLDTVSYPDVTAIEGRVKPDKIQRWADATESRIGRRIGFVFNDTVIMNPTVNCRIESGGFSICSPDKALIIKIFNSLKDNR